MRGHPNGGRFYIRGRKKELFAVRKELLRVVDGAYYFNFFYLKNNHYIWWRVGGKIFFIKKIMAIYDRGWVVRLFTIKIPKYTSKIRQIMPQKMRGKFYVFIVCCRVLWVILVKNIKYKKINTDLFAKRMVVTWSFFIIIKKYTSNWPRGGLRTVNNTFFAPPYKVFYILKLISTQFYIYKNCRWKKLNLNIIFTIPHNFY